MADSALTNTEKLIPDVKEGIEETEVTKKVTVAEPAATEEKNNEEVVEEKTDKLAEEVEATETESTKESTNGDVEITKEKSTENGNTEENGNAASIENGNSEEAAETVAAGDACSLKRKSDVSESTTIETSEKKQKVEKEVEESEVTAC